MLKRRGKIFHYVGEPGKLSGKNFLKGIIKRLLLAGFKEIIRVEEAKGLIIRKS